MKKVKIGIIGCGLIGSELARAIEKDFAHEAKIVAVNDLIEEKASRLAASLKSKPKILPLEKLIKKSALVIEAASADVAGEVVRRALIARRDVMVMSVGGLLDESQFLFELAEQRNHHIYLPSGALCGLDGVKSASVGRIEKAMLTTRKPPKGLEDAPYIVKKKIDLSQLSEETVIFEGTAREAVEGFPKNINVSATLSLAGIGPEKTRVKIITSPHYTSNIHEVELEGDFGRLTARTENVPSPQNPATSFLAVLSAIATLKQIVSRVKIGT